MKITKVTHRESLVAVVERLVSDLSLKVTKTTIQNRLMSHHEYPSLLTLKDTLAEWKINSIALKLSPDNLREIALPCIALVADGISQFFVLVNRVTEREVTYYNPMEGDLVVTTDQFNERWDGTTLMIVVDEKSGEKYYSQSRKKEVFAKLRRGFIYIALMMLAAIIAMLSGSDVGTLLLFVKFAGLFLCILLLMEDVGQVNQISEKICGLSDQTSCKTVLSSPAAKLFGLIGMADIGLLYFAGGVIGMFTSSIAGVQAPFIKVLIVLNLFALPYTLFSTYYQAKVVRMWCPLCVGVQALLWVEFVIGLWHGLDTTPEQFEMVSLLFLIAFLTPSLLLAALKPYLTKDEEAATYKKAAIKFKRDEELFDFNLDRSPYIEVSSLPNDLVLGSANAGIELTLVSGPNCPFCSYAHTVLEDLLEYGEDEVKLIIRFTVDNNNPGSNSNTFVKHVLSLQPIVEQAALRQAIHEWYRINDYNKWAVKYPVVMQDDIDSVFYEHARWVFSTGIQHTPTILINGKQISSLYSLEDMHYLITRKIETLTPIE